MYATIHVIIFIDLDYGLAWSLIIQTIFEKPYIVVGMLAFLMSDSSCIYFLRYLEEATWQKLETPASIRLSDCPAGGIALCLGQKR